jgi:hypothetical protein
LVNQLAEKVDKDKLELTGTLLASYVISGCDSVSYPLDRGKKRAANVALQLVGKMSQLTDFSHTDSSVSPTVIDEARNFFCNLYCRPGYSSLDFSLYKQANECNPVLLPLVEFGRQLDDNGRLIPVMMHKESKPAAAKLVFCKCKKGCIKNCPCAKAGPACIIACSCNGDRTKCGRLTEDSDDED